VFADTLSFTTTIHAGVDPSVTIEPVMKRFRLAEGNIHLRAERTDIHKVTLAMSIDRTTQRRMSSGGLRTFAITPLSTAPVQTDGNARERVLQELDRQRVLEQNFRIFSLTQ
jgi:hypothetical protein